MKIAVIRFSALGDIAASLPVLRNLKYKPVIITTKVGKELLKDEFDEFLLLDSKKIKDVFKLILKIRKYKFDYIFDLQTNDRSKIITKLSNSKNIINSEQVDKSQQVTKIFYDVFAQIGTKIIEPLNFCYKEKEKTYIVLNCGSSEKWMSKRLPNEKWKEISELLYKKYKLPFYLTGDSSEVNYINELIPYIAGEKISFAGRTSIQDLKKLLSNAYLTVSTDSASMHISASQGTKTIGLFGPTNWVVSAPYGKWSQISFDKTYFKDGIPLNKNSLEIDNYFDNINISTEIKKLELI